MNIRLIRKILIPKILILLVLFLSGGIWSQETKMLITQTACVDIGRIINAVNRDPKKREFLFNKEKGYQEDASTLMAKIQELENYLAENQKLNSRGREEIEKEIEFHKLELEKILLSGTNNDSVEEIIHKGIYRLIKDIAERDGLSIILEKSAGVLYNKPEVDITDKVIAMMSSDNGEEETE